MINSHKGISVSLEDQAIKHYGGYYTIFNGPIPLYTGYSSYSVHQRVYRFFKELAGKSRKDEGHSAAYKFRLDGGSMNWSYGLSTVYLDDLATDFKKLPSDEILESIDRIVAIKLKSRYNMLTIAEFLGP